jgi:predicted RecA/RadA family phage recombinase
LEDSIATLDAATSEGSVEEMSSALLRRLSEDMQNVVQLSTPAPIAADGAEAALDLVFDQLVLDAARKSFPFEKKHRAQGAVRRAYRSHAVPTAAIRERATVRSGVFDGVFDFAVHNGSTVQLVECWSFQLPNQSDLAEQVKAWSWLVHEIRNSGGTEVALDSADRVGVQAADALAART